MSQIDDIQKMLRTIINGQNSFRQEVLNKFDQIESKFDGLEKIFDRFERNLTKRLDEVDKQLARKLEKRPLSKSYDLLTFPQKS